MNLEAAVKTFHHRHGQPIGDRPAEPAGERVELRKRLIEEEFNELMQALEAGDLASIAKEAPDAVIVIIGMCVEYGIPFNDVTRAVHASNMTKDGGTRADGKMLKGPGYVPPDIAGVMGL